MILLTGASGFLGQAIKTELSGYEIISLARQEGNIKTDISKEIPLLPLCDIVIHAAGKAHFVAQNESESRMFFETNVLGTINLLKGLEKAGIPKSFVFVSSVSVYGLETGSLISENFPLKAQDPYGISKIKAEATISQWCAQHNVICTILRLPLIAGPNPPGNLKAMIHGIKKGYYFNIDDGKARKSIVLAEDIAKVIPVATNIGGIYNLTDGYHPNFSELSQLVAKQLGKSKPLNIPMYWAKLMAKAGDLIGPEAPINSAKLMKITSELTFDDSKARKFLSWKPTLVLSGFKINS
jgi:nucleoside-diphosphate-sugar epimerase